MLKDSDYTVVPQKFVGEVIELSNSVKIGFKGEKPDTNAYPSNMSFSKGVEVDNEGTSVVIESDFKRKRATGSREVDNVSTVTVYRKKPKKKPTNLVSFRTVIGKDGIKYLSHPPISRALLNQVREDLTAAANAPRRKPAA